MTHLFLGVKHKSWRMNVEENHQRKKYSCPRCDFSTNFKEILDHHVGIRSHEFVLEKFSCAYCDRTFQWKGALVAHEKTHTEGKPFSCTLCNRSFQLKAHLALHEKAHAKAMVYILLFSQWFLCYIIFRKYWFVCHWYILIFR